MVVRAIERTCVLSQGRRDLVDRLFHRSYHPVITSRRRITISAFFGKRILSAFAPRDLRILQVQTRSPVVVITTSAYCDMTRARTACLPCKIGKRKCDRNLPSCGLCVRREVDCHYPIRRSVADSLTSSTTLSPERSAPSSDTHNVANAVFFLAPQLHVQARLELSRPDIHFPLSLVPLIDDARDIASKYFSTVHLWLSIISKQTFYNTLLNPLAGRRMELGLLTLGMKLCCSSLDSGLYHHIKAIHDDAEKGFLSITVVQTGLLIALYEIGQAIYPAAYLTVGACARYALALGVDKNVMEPATNRDGLSWNDIEERRRVWWSVVAFDRYASNFEQNDS
jgi:hypothetical protein